MKKLSSDNPFYEFSKIEEKIDLNKYDNKITTFCSINISLYYENY